MGEEAEGQAVGETWRVGSPSLYYTAWDRGGFDFFLRLDLRPSEGSLRIMRIMYILC